ncbi:hypothetical protein CC2G_002815 [Coprinopsis cinerea AmutBmut pab1-1]|nr:hypothetical protein CC2G_002815 [Coprinopsis cinerea AmutBmut pab1-1]
MAMRGISLALEFITTFSHHFRIPDSDDLEKDAFASLDDLIQRRQTIGRIICISAERRSKHVDDIQSSASSKDSNLCTLTTFINPLSICLPTSTGRPPGACGH